MADTRVQREVEEWVRLNWLPEAFGQAFSECRLKLKSGGEYNFNAVSIDGLIAASISTSNAITASGKNAVGKLLKIRSDVLFLLLANVRRRVVVLTQPDMLALCLKEAETGRMPSEIEFKWAEIPTALAKRLENARAMASEEVTPRRVTR